MPCAALRDRAGISGGAPIAPVVKITGNGDTYRRMEEDIDVDAGMVLSGERSFESMTDELEELVGRICGGEPSKAELLGHREYLVDYKFQDIGRCDNVRKE